MRKLAAKSRGCAGMTTLELQTTDRGGGNPTLDYGLRAAV